MTKEFEVEKKFSLEGVNIPRLIEGAELLSEKTFTDVYFDDENYAITKKDMWLRKRGDSFELKVPFNDGVGALSRKLDQYKEITDEERIKEVLGIVDEGRLADCLKRRDINPFASITTTRRKYKKGEFTLDIDQMDFGYAIGEIELLVGSEFQTQQALEKILIFAKENDIALQPVLGKVAEYLKRKRKLLQ